MTIPSHPLDANPDPKHGSYKVLGLLSWAVLAFCLVSLLLAPRLLLDVARLVALYMMLRLLVYTLYYLGGLVAMRRAEKRLLLDPEGGLSPAELARCREVHHLVVIPNFNEPLEILSRTLQSLSEQAQAPRCLSVVLGMEGSEPGARDKARALLALHKNSFHSLLVTHHPADLPGESPGKGTNESWAVRHARRELVERLGIPASRVLVTVVDSDSRLHPAYLAELTLLFVRDPQRHAVVWQAPILLDNDIWLTHAAIRLLTFFSNAVSTGAYMDPWAPRNLYSTYSLSLQLLEEVNFWDPTMLAEDVNIFHRVFFAKGGKACVRHIHLPVHGNPVHGANLYHAAGIFFNQKVRQGLGVAEIGYLLQKWTYPPGAPFFPKLGRLLKLLHDHLFFSTAGIIVALGTVLSILLDHAAVLTLPPASFSPLLFSLLNLLGGSALLVTWITERVRLARRWVDWSPKTLLGEVAAWVFFPVLFFLLMNLPGLLAQTRMLLGKPAVFIRTPKGLDAKLGD